ncbi:alpha/beta hydrolase [Bradyrhizobium sp. LjRoot220]|uniref:alpha/beta fold hydrolase n=1 Tax=Bradyrhizobium sp. LjRoot220 TaxID=3342284 RepID=UPI003ECD7C22
MQTLLVNGYDIAYLDVGSGMPLVCVHGTLGDFRTWYPVLGPLSKTHRVIALSLRHFFPEHWDGAGNDYRMAQHVADVIGFIEQLKIGPVDLMGHSRGGHIAFRVAEQRPDLLRKLVLAEPGGNLDATLGETASAASPIAARIPAAVEKVKSADIDGALALIVDMIDGEGTWKRLPAAPKQQLRDNAFTLIGQVGEDRRPFSRSEAESIRTPTLLIGGGDTQGSLAQIWRVLAQHIPNATTAVIPGARHWIFDQAPQQFSEAVLEFLAA